MLATFTPSSADSSNILPNFNDIFYPRSCDYCCPVVISSDRFEFSRHLRNVHSVKEGGSYICKYGPNGICQTLPLEGVSDHDYESHLRKYHVNAAGLEKPLHNEPFIDEVTVSMKGSFTLQSFTQNLASVLSDPNRTRNERLAFFTRHWGESFIPKTRIASSSALPNINVDHFKSYLDTTAKKHRSYLKARRALLKTLARHDENNRIDADDIPKILLDTHFSLADAETFEVIFLEPHLEQPDRLLIEGKTHLSPTSIARCDSATSLAPSLPDDTRLSAAMEPFDAGNGRYFRRYAALQNILEYYHDLVDSRLNNQLASKSNAFWRTVISYSSLYGELLDARRKVSRVRGSLKSVDEKVYKHMTKIMEVSYARERRKKFLHRLQDIACLRDAQPTVQMLLNQNDYPKALECIETAQDVLTHDLSGVTCFRHLSLQLQELYKVIGRMLQEEFVGLIQKEFGRLCESESETFYQEAQLNPVVLGLLRVREYKFVHVLQHEIVEAVKNTMRQVVKSHVVKNFAAEQITEVDPSLGNLSSQMRRLDFKQWCEALKHVLEVLFNTCRKVQSIQEIIIENIGHFNQLFKDEEEPYLISRSFGSSDALPTSVVATAFEESSKDTLVSHYEEYESETEELPVQFNSIIVDEAAKSVSSFSPANLSGSVAEPLLHHSHSAISVSSTGKEVSLSDKLNADSEKRGDLSRFSIVSTPGALLSIPCRDVHQVRESVMLLLEHAIYACQERSCRLLVARSKDGFLERLSVHEFHSVIQLVEEFVTRCRHLSGEKEKYLPPLRICITKQCSAFIKKFHDDRKAKLGNILDSENWRSSEVPEHFQKLVNECCATGRLHDISNTDATETLSQAYLDFKGENFIVVGAALFLIQMLAQYCDALDVLPDYASELLMCVIELLKNYNSRSCQLILGAGALQLIGLKSISVRHLALSSRCLQLILKFVPYVKSEFERHLGEAKQNLMRHFMKVTRDYIDHIQEIINKLVSVIDHHIFAQLQAWDLKGTIPSPSFQQICRQLGRFYNGLAGIMPENMIRDLFCRVHEDFKSNFKKQLDVLSVTPHDSLRYGLANQEYSFYFKSLQSMPCCSDWEDESISEVLFTNS